MIIFFCNEPWIGHSGDDEDDDPCLSDALLHVSDEFDCLSCLCDADSFILVALAPCTTASSGARRPKPTTSTTHYSCLHQPNNCTVNFFIGSSLTATTSCRRRLLVIDTDYNSHLSLQDSIHPTTHALAQ